MTWSIGRYLRDEREARQISIEELSQVTRIPLRTLHHIETDAFEELPGDVFTRGFLRSYAKTLGIDAAPVLAQLDANTKAAGKEEEPKTIATVTSDDRGKRFGIAVALAILLILFTLALSIVLRPRHRNVPIELSSATSEPLTRA